MSDNDCILGPDLKARTVSTLDENKYNNLVFLTIGASKQTPECVSYYDRATMHRKSSITIFLRYSKNTISKIFRSNHTAGASGD